MGCAGYRSFSEGGLVYASYGGYYPLKHNLQRTIDFLPRFAGVNTCFSRRVRRKIHPFSVFLSHCIHTNVSIFQKDCSVWTVYILKCCDASFYTGCTSNITDRLIRHNNRQVKYTSSRLPIEIIVTINFNNKYRAYEFESYLKSGSGRAFMIRHLL